jgi:GAF domain-containing protein
MTRADAAFVAAVSDATDPDQVWSALAALADAAAGHRLFTVTLVDQSAEVVRRAYSSRPGEYPTSGTKPLHGNTGNWFEHVFTQRRTFVANTLADIAEVFPDHELIGSLGCGSVVNIPIVLTGQLVATLNLLDAEGHYTPDRVTAAEEHLALPARLCVALAWSFAGRGMSA